MSPNLQLEPGAPPEEPELTVRRKSGQSASGALRFELTYGGAVILHGSLAGGETTLSLPAPEVADWMDGAALGLRGWSASRKPAAIEGTVRRAHRDPTGAEQRAGRAWPDLKHRRGGRQDLRDRSPHSPAVVYRSAADLVAIRRDRFG